MSRTSRDLDPEILHQGIGERTKRKDNTREERIKALVALTDHGFDLSEAMDMLGIEPEWVLTPDPTTSFPEPTGLRRKRNHRSGPARL